MSLDTKAVDLFLRVVALGAIGRAGEALGLSPTAATQRIQALEHSLGVRLFHRTTRTVSLTTDGALFVEHARRIVADIEDARAAVGKASGRVSGLLRVAAPAAFGQKYIAPFVGDFLSRYPDLRMQLELGDALVDIGEQGFDMAIRSGNHADSSQIAERLAPLHRLIVAAPSYIERRGAPAEPGQIAAHDCLTHSSLREWRLAGADGSVRTLRPAGLFETNDHDALTAALLSGLGIALKSSWDVGPLIAEGRLVPLLTDYMVTPETSMWAVYPSARLVPPRVRLFVDHLKASFGEPDPVWDVCWRKSKPDQAGLKAALPG